MKHASCHAQQDMKVLHNYGSVTKMGVCREENQLARPCNVREDHSPVYQTIVQGKLSEICRVLPGAKAEP